MSDQVIDSYVQALRDNRRGKQRGVFSVCSAHPMVLDAAIRRALQDRDILCIESTSNQVDQFGGYTGMKPADFSAWVWKMAEDLGLPKERVLLGGDHLGPNSWRSKPIEEAMQLSEVLVRDYVRAGYRKIHLDCSMALAGDVIEPGKPLPDELVARRAARLCRAAEAAAKENPLGPLPVYVIGTEVPIPGGAQEHEDHVACTSVAAARQTIETTKAIFEQEGLADAWSRVSAAVVQPGVEFGDDFVSTYDPVAASELSRFIESQPGLVFEAHSTDYQSRQALRQLVSGHFAILKVGPWLTFALREALYGLARVEEELAALGRIAQPSRLMAVVDSVMDAEPKYWKAYYHEDAAYKRRYSYSDRIRYYWTHPQIDAAVQSLLKNLEAGPLPEALVQQYFPDCSGVLLAKSVGTAPRALIRAKIDAVLDVYADACGHLRD